MEQNDIEKNVIIIMQQNASMKTDLSDLKEAVKDIKESTKEFGALSEKENNSEKRIEKLESNQKWFVCAILGIVIAGILKLVIK